MPLDADALTEAHRRNQAFLSAQTSDSMLEAWRILNPRNLAGTTPEWLAVTETVIARQANRSANVSAEYYSAFREVRVGEPFHAVPVVDVAAVEVRTSMVVTGPIQVRRSIGVGHTLDRAMEIGREMSARAASRWCLSGGRGTIETAVASDPVCLGYARATSGSPCAFCAMVASRGPTYKSKNAALRVVGRSGSTRGSRPLGAKYHDGCHCVPVPIYSTNDPWPQGSQQFTDLWKRAKENPEPGVTQFQQFRRLLSASA